MVFSILDLCLLQVVLQTADLIFGQAQKEKTLRFFTANFYEVLTH